MPPSVENKTNKSVVRSPYDLTGPMARLDLFHSPLSEPARHEACMLAQITAATGERLAGSYEGILAGEDRAAEKCHLSVGSPNVPRTVPRVDGTTIVFLWISLLLLCGAALPSVATGGVADGEPHSSSRGGWPSRGDHKQDGGASNNSAASRVVAQKVFGFLSDFASQIGSDVKNSIMQQVSEVRTSKLYKRAKHLVNPPSISSSAVAEKLLHAGEGLLDFLVVFQQIPPQQRHSTLVGIFAKSSSLRRARRKYVHLEAYINPQATFDSLGALGRFIGEVNKVVGQEAGGRAGVSGEVFSVGRKPHDRDIAPVFEAVNRVLARSLSVLGSLLTQDATVAVELATFIRQMLPRWKQVFAETWRLSRALTSSEQREARCSLADYLDDLLLFDYGLKATAETLAKSGALIFDPEDCYFTPPTVPPSVLYVDTSGIMSPARTESPWRVPV